MLDHGDTPAKAGDLPMSLSAAQHLQDAAKIEQLEDDFLIMSKHVKNLMGQINTLQQAMKKFKADAERTDQLEDMVYDLMAERRS